MCVTHNGGAVSSDSKTTKIKNIFYNMGKWTHILKNFVKSKCWWYETHFYLTTNIASGQCAQGNVALWAAAEFYESVVVMSSVLLYYIENVYRTRQGEIWKFVRNANKSDNILKYILFLHIQCVFTNNLCDVARVYSLGPLYTVAQSLNINGAREVVCLSGCIKWMQHRWGRVIHRLHSSSTEFYIRF